MNDDMLDVLAAQLSPLTHTEWMHLYNWPPGFVSVGATPPGQKQQYRANGGFDRNPIGLLGAIPYVIKGPVENMERK